MTTAEAAPLEPGHSFAPAKINLTLHVTGQRADGYHTLDTLVAFADLGDMVTIAPACDLSLDVRGPFAGGVPTGAENLVLRAARLAGMETGAITLDKHLPPSSGIGGGSSDAAALLRALGRDLDLPPEAILTLGADVPMCLLARAAHVSGIGDVVCPVPDLPALPAVLVNPGVAVSTAQIFATLSERNNAPMTVRPDRPDVPTVLHWLAAQRNDLEQPAIAHAPVIAEALAALRDAGSALARMSGSGATCVGLFRDLDAAHKAERRLMARHPGWWVRTTLLT